MCSGENAPLTAAARSRGWRSEAIDVRVSEAARDLCRPCVVQALVVRILAGGFDPVMLAPPYGTYSCWVRMCATSSRAMVQP